MQAFRELIPGGLGYWRLNSPCLSGCGTLLRSHKTLTQHEQRVLSDAIQESETSGSDWRF